MLSPRRQRDTEPDAEARRGDERLARAVATGDERAFAELYDRYTQRLYGYCWTMLRNEANAQDALQSTWLKAFAALREGRRAAPVRPWLFRIAHNESISMLRRLERGDGAIAAGGPVPSAEEQALRRERLHEVIGDLRQLPERRRGPLVLQELCGLSHEEIAHALDTTIGVTKQSILEARRDLQDFEVGRATACEEVRHKIAAGDQRVLRGRTLRAHLRHCSACAAFKVAADQRRARLLGVVPILAPLVAEHVLREVLAGSVGQTVAPAGAAAGAGATAGGSIATATGVTGGGVVAGAAKSGGTALIAKIAVGLGASGVAAIGCIGGFGGRAPIGRPHHSAARVAVAATAAGPPAVRSRHAGAPQPATADSPSVGHHGPHRHARTRGKRPHTRHSPRSGPSPRRAAKHGRRSGGHPVRPGQARGHHRAHPPGRRRHRRAAHLGLTPAVTVHSRPRRTHRTAPRHSKRPSTPKAPHRSRAGKHSARHSGK